MEQRKTGLMGKLISDNKWYFIAALVCTLFTVAIEFITPIILAETMDHYLLGKASRMPGFVNAWIDSFGGRDFMAGHLWIAGLALVGLNVLNGGSGVEIEFTAGEPCAKLTLTEPDVDTVYLRCSGIWFLGLHGMRKRKHNEVLH